MLAPPQINQADSAHKLLVNASSPLANNIQYPVNPLMNGIGQQSLLYRPAYGVPAPFQYAQPNAVSMLEQLFPYPSALAQRPFHTTTPPVVRLQGSLPASGYTHLQGPGAAIASLAQRPTHIIGMQYAYGCMICIVILLLDMRLYRSNSSF
jgi:hypothetical protein